MATWVYSSQKPCNAAEFFDSKRFTHVDINLEPTGIAGCNDDDIINRKKLADVGALVLNYERGLQNVLILLM